MLNINSSFRWLNTPELNVAIFSFLLNFFWEMQQMPFFQVSPEFTCVDVVNNCTLATVGDAGISITAFATVANSIKVTSLDSPTELVANRYFYLGRNYYYDNF